MVWFSLCPLCVLCVSVVNHLCQTLNLNHRFQFVDFRSYLVYPVYPD
jgi:hypothetical protein